MNDRHPSVGSNPADPAPDASYPYDEAYGQQQDTAHGHVGYDGYSTGSFDQLGTAYGDGDPLFGALPGSDGGYDGYAAGHSGQYDASQWGTTGQQTGTYDHAGHYETGAYDTTAMWAASGYQLPTSIPAQQTAETGAQWDISAWGTDATGQMDLTGQMDATGHVEIPAQWDNSGTAYDASALHDATALLGAAALDNSGYDTGAYQTYDSFTRSDLTSGVDTGQTQFWDTTAFATVDEPPHNAPHHTPDDAPYDAPLDDHPGVPAAEPEPEAAAEHEPASETDVTLLSPPSPSNPSSSAPGARRGNGGANGRARRRTVSSRPKRSALLTVAVPSVCALGVSAVAAASVGMSNDKKDGATTQAAPDSAPPVEAAAVNSKLDTQLAEVREGADDFRDRASRTQERIDLKERQAAEKKRKAEAAARKEALRPKFALPVAQHGLSATFGQAGINWMSVHTGIDFPVSYGTPVMSATDGTVRTQWNDAYGNMVIVTGPDGTETWYCHLSSAKIRSGSVQAGDTIAFSGNSGNSTGPHLHFEVHPGGGEAVDPLPWLRGHGLDPS
ncbi:M23 family metallopeptidase [Streptomyces sp. NA02950]|uniref:M23 family metallopeptidase n=1 Tax=Streptomyces sp. NA02950 TaxID=2742137 RepID=UPI0015901877|nr:M23 family metallopeptidase [Streptomyces sp. NA02950]QKV94417.1 M23 family metallopeptidase [Streptomyces sp. NA02950]